MAEKDKDQGTDSLELNETINKAEGYLTENKKSITIIAEIGRAHV